VLVPVAIELITTINELINCDQNQYTDKQIY